MFNPVTIHSEQDYDAKHDKYLLEILFHLIIFKYIDHKYMKIMVLQS